MRLSIQVVLIAVLLLLALWIVLGHDLPSVLAYVNGKAEGCSFTSAVHALDTNREQREMKDWIVARSRLLDKDPVGVNRWETPEGRWWVANGSDYSLHFDLAEQKRRIYGTGADAVRRGDIVLDCGANIGVYTRQALDLGASKVVAIEPAPENLECLRRNLEAEIAAGLVIIYPKGVWDSEGVLKMNIDPSNAAANSFVVDRGTGRTLDLPLTTIDKLVAELGLPRVDYIKMDIEGAEPRAIAGARETIRRFRPRMALSVYHTPSDKKTVVEAVQAASPDYSFKCGPCMEHEGRIFPTVYYFSPQGR